MIAMASLILYSRPTSLLIRKDYTLIKFYPNLLTETPSYSHPFLGINL